MKAHINEIVNLCEGFSYEDLQRTISELQSLAETKDSFFDSEEFRSHKFYKRNSQWELELSLMKLKNLTWINV